MIKKALTVLLVLLAVVVSVVMCVFDVNINAEANRSIENISAVSETDAFTADTEDALLSKTEYNNLNATEKSNYALINIEFPLIGNINSGEKITSGSYMLLKDGVGIYVCAVVPKGADDKEYKIYCNDKAYICEKNTEWSDLSENEIYISYYLGYWQNGALDDGSKEFNIRLESESNRAIISPEEYADLDVAAKSQYAQIGFNGLYVAYVKEGETSGTFIEAGSYVKKGTTLYFSVPIADFNGSHLTIIHDDSTDDYTETAYLIYNGSDGWIYTYTIKNSDISVYVEAHNDVPGILTPEEYANLIPDMKSYYAKVNIQSPAYVGIGGGENFFILSDGYYVLKNIYMWVAAFPNDYVGNRILVNGEPFDVTLQPDFGNYGGGYVVGAGENNITVEIEPDNSWKNAAVSIEDESGIEVYYYKGASNEPGLGKEVYSEDNIPVGTPLLISCYKNLIFGYDISVNGEIVSLWKDGEYMSGIYCSNEKELYIGREERELNDYEKANCVPIYFGSEMEVVEFPFSDGYSGDEWHITYDSGNIIEKGTTLRIVVKASDYAGKALKINGTEFDMYINGDGSHYLLDYRIPQDIASAEITLEAKTSGFLGDVSGDGKLNNTDIILLGRSYMAGDSAKYIAVADMNNDGRITNADIILLGRLYMSTL